MFTTTHLGRNASVLEQHSGPHSWVTGHKLPVTADLCSSQQGFSIQVGEDAEEGCTHLQDLWTDHLVGFGRALFMAAWLVDPVRPTCGKKIHSVHLGLMFDSSYSYKLLLPSQD